MADRDGGVAVTAQRLRPAVHASPTPDGIYVRGGTTAFSVAGGTDLWRLWQRLEPALRHGVAEDSLGTAGTRSATRRAVHGLVSALREHDMMVAASWGEKAPPGWLEQLAPDPADAWHRLTTGSVTVTGQGPVAAAAASALTAAGVRNSATTANGLVVLDAGAAGAVTAGAGPDGGFATNLRTPGRVVDRLGIPMSWQVPEPVAAVVGGVAAHQLICLLAGLPGEGEWPRVFIARPEPLVAASHPWLLDGPVLAAPNTLSEALTRVDALCDPDLGLLPPPRFDTVPQLPASLATCGDELGIGTTTGAARLDAVLRAAERLLDPDGGLAVGADDSHADGILLRRAVFDVTGRRAVAATDPCGGHGWRGDPAAERWWTALTVRFGVPARCTVATVADVFVALVEADGRELGWAVESTPGDAAGAALLGAVAAHQAGFARIGAALAMEARPTEERLQRSLRAIAGATGIPTRSGDLWDGLHACGFAVRELIRND